MGMVKRDEGKVKDAIVILKDLELEEIRESNPLFYSGVLRNIAISYKDLANLNLAYKKLNLFYDKAIKLHRGSIDDLPTLLNKINESIVRNHIKMDEFFLQEEIPRKVSKLFECAEKYIKQSMNIGK